MKTTVFDYLKKEFFLQKFQVFLKYMKKLVEGKLIWQSYANSIKTKKVVLKNFSMFIGKHLNKVAGLRLHYTAVFL